MTRTRFQINDNVSISISAECVNKLFAGDDMSVLCLQLIYVLCAAFNYNDFPQTLLLRSNWTCKMSRSQICTDHTELLLTLIFSNSQSVSKGNSFQVMVHLITVFWYCNVQNMDSVMPKLRRMIHLHSEETIALFMSICPKFVLFQRPQC